MLDDNFSDLPIEQGHLNYAKDFFNYFYTKIKDFLISFSISSPLVSGIVNDEIIDRDAQQKELRKIKNLNPVPKILTLFDKFADLNSVFEDLQIVQDKIQRLSELMEENTNRCIGK